MNITRQPTFFSLTHTLQVWESHWHQHGWNNCNGTEIGKGGKKDHRVLLSPSSTLIPGYAPMTRTEEFLWKSYGKPSIVRIDSFLCGHCDGHKPTRFLTDLFSLGPRIDRPVWKFCCRSIPVKTSKIVHRLMACFFFFRQVKVTRAIVWHRIF